MFKIPELSFNDKYSSTPALGLTWHTCITHTHTRTHAHIDMIPGRSLVVEECHSINMSRIIDPCVFIKKINSEQYNRYQCYLYIYKLFIGVLVLLKGQHSSMSLSSASHSHFTSNLTSRQKVEYWLTLQIKYQYLNLPGSHFWAASAKNTAEHKKVWIYE